MEWTALRLSLELALATAAVLLVIGIPLALWLATSTSRARVVVDAVVALPLVLPPTVLGFYLLVALGPDGPIGAPLALVDVRLPFTFGGLLFGSVIFNLPFAVRPFTAAFGSVERRFLEQAYCTGLSRTRAFFRVTLPLAAPGVVTGLVLTIAHATGEFGVVMMLGGSIPGVTRTLSVAIYDDVQALDYASAHRAAAVLLAISFVALVVALRGRRRAAIL